MGDLLDEIEDARLARRLTQAAVANELGVSQPHYSKVVGRVVALSPAVQARMRAWIENTIEPQPLKELDRRILSLSRAIQRQSRELGILLTTRGKAPARRSVIRARQRQN